MKPNAWPKAVLVAALALSALSCSMRQNLTLDSNGGGLAEFDIQLAPYLTEVIDQVALLVDPTASVPSDDEPFFDLPAIREDFSGRDDVELLSLESPTRNRLTGEIRFDSVETLFQEIEEGSVESRMVRFQDMGDFKGVTVSVNRNTVDALLEANPSFNNPLVENFGPATTQGLSDADYLDMMEFALGEESRLGIQESSMILTIRVQGEILEQSGGVLMNDQTVRYSIPLLPFLMLREPLEYSLRYR